MKYDCIERRLANLFHRYGKTVHRYPAPFILLPVIVTGVLAYAFYSRLEVSKDDISLYTPSDGRAKSELRSLTDHFRMDDRDIYYSERRYDSKRFGYIIATSVNDQENILSPHLFDELVLLWNHIEKINVKIRRQTFNYSSLCVKASIANSCVVNPLLQMYTAHPMSLAQMHYPLTTFGVFLGNVLGGVVLNSQSTIFSAKAILLPYQLKHSSRDADAAAEQWENSFNDLLSNYKSSQLSLSWWTSETLALESYKDMRILLKLLAPLFVTVTVFTICCCFVKSWLRSKPWLGLCGVGSAAGAIVAAMGVCLFFGEKLTSVSYFMPFVIFSIGVDNVFILIAAWRKTSVFLPTSERMGASLKEAGVSITVTSLTDVLSFGVGCASNFPSVKNFCLYAAVAVTFVYTFQLTFFAGCMAVSGNREGASRNCLTLKTMRDNPAKVWSSDFSASYGEMAKSVREEDKVANHMLARFFRGPYTNFLIHPVTKCVVIFVTLVYIGVAAWGCTRIQVGLHPADLLPKASPARDTLRLTEAYFSEYSDYLHLWFTNLTTLNYDTRFWLVLDREVRRFENTTYSEYGDSWLRSFIIFARSADFTVTPENFLHVLKNVFLPKPFYEKYTRDVVFAPQGFGNATRLESVRFLVRLRNVSLTRQNDAARFFRKLADDSPLNAHVYNDFFQFADQFDAIVPSILSNIGQGSAAVVLASLLLIPKPLCSIWVCATIASINVGIFGYMALWDVHLDFVSMVTITMSIGFSVDFSAHIAYHFAKESGVSAVNRVRDSVYVIGTPILQSAVSTLLGVLMLVYVDNYVFRSFLKTSSLIILLGVVHGLVILPVMLTLFHCEDYDAMSEPGSSEDNLKKSLDDSSGNCTRRTSLATTLEHDIWKQQVFSFQKQFQPTSVQKPQPISSQKPQPTSFQKQQAPVCFQKHQQKYAAAPAPFQKQKLDSRAQMSNRHQTNYKRQLPAHYRSLPDISCTQRPQFDQSNYWNKASRVGLSSNPQLNNNCYYGKHYFFKPSKLSQRTMENAMSNWHLY